MFKIQIYDFRNYLITILQNFKVKFLLYRSPKHKNYCLTSINFKWTELKKFMKSIGTRVPILVTFPKKIDLKLYIIRVIVYLHWLTQWDNIFHYSFKRFSSILFEAERIFLISWTFEMHVYIRDTAFISTK